MANVYEGKHSIKGKRFAIVIARFNELVTKMLLEGAVNELRRSGVGEADIDVIWVPGAYEIPIACQKIALERKAQGIVTLGCIIRGETSHYEQLAQSTSDGILRVALEHHLPIGYGVLTVENLNQALDRSGGKIGNKGRDAAHSVVEMANLLTDISEDTKRDSLVKEFVEHAIGKK